MVWTAQRLVLASVCSLELESVLALATTTARCSVQRSVLASADQLVLGPWLAQHLEPQFPQLAPQSAQYYCQ